MDVSPAAVARAKTTAAARAKITTLAKVKETERTVDDTDDEGQGVIVECIRESGKVRVRVAPRARHSGIAYAHRLPEFPPLPPNIVAAAMSGVKEASQSGPGGYPMEDLEVTVLSVETREGQSPEIGTKIAASNAFRAACAEAGPRLLEPIMAVEVVVPEDFLGAAIGDLNQRRGRIEDVGSRGEKRIIQTKVPLQRMFGYSTVLRSLSQGRATYSMQFAEYDAWE